jgi:DNA-binding LacI/PurR family transcriptional regulator
MSISLRRLAQLAEVSPSSAWRALHGHGDASPAMRRKILALARKHHFPLPPTQVEATSNLLKVLCSMIDLDSDEDQSERGYGRRLLAGVQKGADDCGVELANYRFDPEVWPLAVDRQQVDGVVVIQGSEFEPHPPLPPPVPAVFMFSGPKEADVIAIDDFDAGRTLAEHLCDPRNGGHTRFAYIGSQTAISMRRLAGAMTYLQHDRIVMPQACICLERDVGSRVSAELLCDQLLAGARPGDSGPHGFTALIVYNDYMAAAVIMHLRQRGIRVPEDVSVAGFDNLRPAWYNGPAITTMAVPLEDIGAEAARLLYWRLAHPGAPPRRLTLNATLVARESTRASG